jgi:hypothetical protein
MNRSCKSSSLTVCVECSGTTLLLLYPVILYEYNVTLRLKVVTAAKILIMVFWVVTPCSLVNV